MTVNVFTANELRQDIRWVVLLDLPLADGSLQPEERHRHVPDLPHASPPADAPASRANRVDPYLRVDPEILCHGLHRETLSPAWTAALHTSQPLPAPAPSLRTALPRWAHTDGPC